MQQNLEHDFHPNEENDIKKKYFFFLYVKAEVEE